MLPGQGPISAAPYLRSRLQATPGWCARVATPRPLTLATMLLLPPFSPAVAETRGLEGFDRSDGRLYFPLNVRRGSAMRSRRPSDGACGCVWVRSAQPSGFGALGSVGMVTARLVGVDGWRNQMGGDPLGIPQIGDDDESPRFWIE